MIKTVEASEAKKLIEAGARAVEWKTVDGKLLCSLEVEDAPTMPEMVEDTTEAGEDEAEEE